MALVGPVGPSFLSELQSSTNLSRGPGGLSEGGPYLAQTHPPEHPCGDGGYTAVGRLGPTWRCVITILPLLEAGPLPALLSEPTSGRVGLDRVQYARPMAAYAWRVRTPPHTGRTSYEHQEM